MQELQVRTPKRKPLPKGEIGFHRTREVLKKIIRQEFYHSQTNLAGATDYSLALVNRVVTGERPPTSDFVGAVLKVTQSHDLGVDLLTAFLCETASSVTGNYKVSVEVR